MNKTFNAVPETSATRRLSPATLILRQMPLPANAADLCTRLYKNDSIREAAGLDSEEYKHVMFTARHLAGEILNKCETWDKQSQTAKQNFLNAASSQLPLLDDYEECWPITLYITRYLENTRRWHVSPPRKATVLSLKPELIKYLSDPARSSNRYFWKATRLSKNKCTMVVLILQRLANQHLQIDTLYSSQDKDQIRHVHRLAIREMPVLSTQFEGAWPIKVYLTRYLCKKVSDINAKQLHRFPTEEQSSEDESLQRMGNRHWRSEPWGGQERDDREWRGGSPSQAWDRDNQSRFASTTVVQTENSKPIPAPPRRPIPNPPVAGPSRSAPVQAFLRSLRPSMEDHLPLFLAWGIQDENSLLSLKRWSSEEQDRFLAEKFNRFQIYAIKNGLHAL